MRKLYLSLSLFLLCISLVSCNDWLDVQPRSQIKSTALFSTEDGYKLAMNGVYIKIGNSGLYGTYTSMFVPDALARMWTFPSEKTSLLYGLSNHNYTISEAENCISTLFSEYYNAIAQLNDIIYNIENSTIFFEHKNDQIIEGEAYGLRAFLHMEILRFFGPIPLDAKDSDEAIPYVTELTSKTDRLMYKSWKEVIGMIEQDLTKAENLLKGADPILNLSLDELNNIGNVGNTGMPGDDWQFYRQGRFNYYAVLGAKARFYHWIGNKENAVKYAKMVVDSQKFQLVNDAYFSASKASLSMYQEHLFGVENPDLENVVQSLFQSENASLTQTSAKISSAYEGTVHVNDIRNISNRYWQEKVYANSKKTNHFCKYIGNGVIETDNRIPLLRYVEMYFILIEDLPLADAKKYFVEYRQSRGLSSMIDNTSMNNENSVLERLEKEYRKEFYGEGQLFFFYKRHKYQQLTWPDNYAIQSSAYVLPKPKGISDFE